MGHSSVKNDIASLQQVCSVLLQRSGTAEGGSGDKAGTQMAKTKQKRVTSEAAKEKVADQPETVDEGEDAK